jgi:chemotaxis signal transduction protein
VKGVINLRGKVIPVIDLRGMAKTAGNVKILLDIARVLSASEMELIGEAA